jgi:uncharacterized protein DUF3108
MKIFKTAMLAALTVSLFTACEKDNNALTIEEETAVDYFIPRDKNVYHYEVTGTDGEIATRDIFVNNYRDSGGIAVTNVRTDISSKGEVLTTFNDMYSLKGRTTVKIDKADFLLKALAKMKVAIEQAGGKITKSELSGYPYRMNFDNALLEGGKLDFSGPSIHKYELSYITGTGSTQVRIDIVQDITFFAGEVEKVEQVTVPAGTFTCNKFFYTMNTKQVTKMNGSIMNTLDNTEEIELWMAHGIGDVKIVEKLNNGVATTILKSIQKQ